LSRLIARDGIDETLARRMLAHQASRTERLALADDVIENSDAEPALDEAVSVLHQRYLAMASAGRSLRS
jgi:dephospho-CoA kinase